MDGPVSKLLVLAEAAEYVSKTSDELNSFISPLGEAVVRSGVTVQRQEVKNSTDFGAVSENWLSNQPNVNLTSRPCSQNQVETGYVARSGVEQESSISVSNHSHSQPHSGLAYRGETYLSLSIICAPHRWIDPDLYPHLHLGREPEDIRNQDLNPATVSQYANDSQESWLLAREVNKGGRNYDAEDVGMGFHSASSSIEVGSDSASGFSR
nr:hypothetical protein [Endozoicomonas sp.]